jgi:excisionase family DNA binding protein
MPHDHEILTLGEAAEYLRVSPEKLHDLVQHAQIPGRLVGEEWRFSKTALTAWVSHRRSIVDDPVWWDPKFFSWHRTAELLGMLLARHFQALERMEALLEDRPAVTQPTQRNFRDFAGTFKGDPSLDKIVEEAYERRRSVDAEAKE